MEVLSLLNMLPSSKAEVESFVAQVSASVESDPLQVALQLKCMEEVCSRLRKDKTLREAVVDRLQLEGDKVMDVDYKSAVFTVAETGVKYDYQEDAELEGLLHDKGLIDKAIKARQAKLKGISSTMIEEETGEVLKPAIKTSTTNYKITLK